ncbi:phosphatase PAP2 family protein [Paenibacillus segetis]|uniref:Inositol phosphorylceramide synthase n=1 Tax=Paenibacillus segetis TaxID=1325360 RepID=A0ABQ1YEH5_9BACL|nr:phosphatase PAP2 family protein [Paenibacillus segetis]GGH22507.1 inositol phosphorylceramide synthase [Paenibacillus segetis]
MAPDKDTKLAKYRPLLWILIIPLLNICYGLLNHEGSRVSNLMTELDAQIPFVPAFIIPYMLWYPFIMVMLIVIFRKSEKTYYQTLITLCVGLVVSYVIYYFYQTTVPRPPVTEHGVIPSLVRFIYMTDQPYNCFPSIHVLTSYLVWKGSADCEDLSFISRSLISVMMGAIVLSTLFVKQHYILDIAGAIFIVQVLYYFTGKMLPVKLRVQNKASINKPLNE